MHFVSSFFGGSFENHGKEVYAEHYRKLEEFLGGPGSGKYLSWMVEEGW